MTHANPDRRYKHPPPKRCACGNRIILHEREAYTKCSMCRRKEFEELNRS